MQVFLCAPVHVRAYTYSFIVECLRVYIPAQAQAQAQAHAHSPEGISRLYRSRTLLQFSRLNPKAKEFQKPESSAPILRGLSPGLSGPFNSNIFHQSLGSSPPPTYQSHTYTEVYIYDMLKLGKHTGAGSKV